MERETRDTRVEIRMNFEEKEKIKRLANLCGKTISTYMRQTALNYPIKEKPSKEFYKVTNQISSIIKLLNEMERLLYHKNFIDERLLNEQITEWKNFRKEVRDSFL